MDGAALARAARSGKRHPVARLVSLMEDTRAASASARDDALAYLEEEARQRGHRSTIIGVTGTPGAGKSSLLAATTREMLRLDPEASIAVVAVDPSSQVTKGALLGDRTRMRTSVEETRLFFRSQASVTALGGLAPPTYLVVRALTTLYDYVLVETVGIGQSEADIKYLADTVYLVMSPGGGDDVQMIKAGIVEIPDAFVINKADTPGASAAYYQLRGALWLARPFDADRVAVLLTSARRGDGITELAQAMLDHRNEAQPPDHLAERAKHFFAEWVRDEWGRQGAQVLEPDPTMAGRCDPATNFGAAQAAFTRAMQRHLAGAESGSGGDQIPR